jgi:hypothetical protein
MYTLLWSTESWPALVSDGPRREYFSVSCSVAASFDSSSVGGMSPEAFVILTGASQVFLPYATNLQVVYTSVRCIFALQVLS